MNEQTITSSTGISGFNPADIISDQTEPIIHLIKNFMTVPFLMKLIGTVFMLFILYVTYRILRKVIKKIPENKLKPQYAHLLKKALKYLYYSCVCVYVLGLFGIKFSVIWGAAGVAGVALGFAAQTSVSNIISGLFVLSERAMQVGDQITVDGITGIVDSTDLLSVKIHTMDNQLVRIPNSTIINNNLVNTSFYPNRRFSIGVDVSYDTDLEKALAVLLEAAAKCPTVLKDPEAKAWVDHFDDSGINLVLAIWFKKEDFLKTKNDAFISIKKSFDEAGISIPFNRLEVSILPENPVDKSV